jgi:hypothetical protein
MSDVEVMEWLEGGPPATANFKNAEEYAPVREQLKSQPGRWARLYTGDDKTTARSLTMKMRYPDFKFAFRKTREDEFAVFGKYDPDDED